MNIDQQIIDRIANGDSESEEVLIRSVRPGLFIKACRLYSGDYDRAEDITQNACIGLLENIRSGMAHDNWPAHAYRILKNKFIDDIKKRKEVKLRPLSMSSDSYDEPSYDVDLIGRLSDKEIIRRIHDALPVLRKEWRPLVVLRLEGRGYGEISEDLGLPIGTVKGWLYRARVRLIQLIQTPEVDEVMKHG